MRTPKVVLLTGNQLRHRYVAHQLARHLALIGIVSEGKASLLAPPTDGSRSPDDKAVIERHVAQRDEAEHRYFGETESFPLEAQDVLFIEHNTVNRTEVLDWVHARQPDLLLLFGTSIVKEPLLAQYHNRVINMHLGLSPYYRGVATNFWPLVNREPECVGVTIHMAVLAVDAGAILNQGRPRAAVTDNAHDLGCKTIQVGAELLGAAAHDAFDGALDPHAQKGGGRLYRRRDFNAEAVRQLWHNLETGMMTEYLADYENRIARFPIVT